MQCAISSLARNSLQTTAGWWRPRTWLLQARIHLQRSRFMVTLPARPETDGERAAGRCCAVWNGDVELPTKMNYSVADYLSRPTRNRYKPSEKKRSRLRIDNGREKTRKMKNRKQPHSFSPALYNFPIEDLWYILILRIAVDSCQFFSKSDVVAYTNTYMCTHISQSSRIFCSLYFVENKE